MTRHPCLSFLGVWRSCWKGLLCVTEAHEAPQTPHANCPTHGPAPACPVLSHPHKRPEKTAHRRLAKHTSIPLAGAPAGELAGRGGGPERVRTPAGLQPPGSVQRASPCFSSKRPSRVGTTLSCDDPEPPGFLCGSPFQWSSASSSLNLECS